MKKIYLGLNREGDRVELDFDQEKIHFILLAGDTGSGKSIFHRNLYKELSAKYSPAEIGFLFLDMTMVDFLEWKSEYLIRPVIHDARQAINALNEIAELKTDKKIFIHIEECDMVYTDRKGVEDALQKLEGLGNVYVVYSTSRIDPEYLLDWMKKFVDLRVIFRVTSIEGLTFLFLQSDASASFHDVGERVLSLGDRQTSCRRRISCRPFSEEEVKKLNNFKL